MPLKLVASIYSVGRIFSMFDPYFCRREAPSSFISIPFSLGPFPVFVTLFSFCPGPFPVFVTLLFFARALFQFLWPYFFWHGPLFSFVTLFSHGGSPSPLQWGVRDAACQVLLIVNWAGTVVKWANCPEWSTKFTKCTPTVTGRIAQLLFSAADSSWNI